MIMVRDTPNHAGVVISGDYMDFDALYEAIHTAVGDEDEYPAYEAARLRILGLAYDLRHAIMGDREVEFVDNGMDTDKMKRLAVITASKNVYLKINILWPEMLFLMMTLNDFLYLYAKKQAKLAYNVFLDRRSIWDTSIAQVRGFQAAAAQCLQSVVSEASFSRLLNLMNKDYPWHDGYLSQYVDVLNIRFIGMTSEKRRKSIPTIAKRLAEYGEEYCRLREEILAAAREYGCSPVEIDSGVDYPEEVIW